MPKEADPVHLWNASWQAVGRAVQDPGLALSGQCFLKAGGRAFPT